MGQPLPVYQDLGWKYEDMELSDMLRSLNCVVGDAFPKDYKIYGVGKVILPSLHEFSRTHKHGNIDPVQAVEMTKGLHCRPATLPELLLRGASFPEDQKQNPIFTVENGFVYILDYRTGHRRLMTYEISKEKPETNILSNNYRLAIVPT
jgi:hypothetical protein